MPALFHLEQQGLLPEKFSVVGVARRDLSKTFAPDMQDGVVSGGGVDKADPKLKEMALLRYSRLSVQPVTDAEWKIVCKMGGVSA